MMLYEAVLERLGTQAVVTGSRLANYRTLADTVEVAFVDQSGKSPHSGNVLVEGPTGYIAQCGHRCTPMRVHQFGVAL